MIRITTSLDKIGFFELVKDEDLSAICETPEEYQLIDEFVREFMKLRKCASDIDNYIFRFIGQNIGENKYTPYWNKIGEYCKLRLCQVNAEEAEMTVRMWSIVSTVGDYERLWGILENDTGIKELRKNLIPYEQNVSTS